MPLVAEQVHFFEHRNDKHCTNTETHFCTQEHHCTLCDYVQSTVDTPVSDDAIKIGVIQKVHKTDFYQIEVVTKLNFVHSLRGPPTIS